MKKQFVWLLAAAMFLSLAACGGGTEVPNASEYRETTETTSETEATAEEATVPDDGPLDEERPDPSKELAGFATFMEVGVPYPHTTGTYDGGDIATTAEATVTSYEVFDSAEDYPAKEGYEWRVVKMEIRYYDEYAEKHGCDICPIFDDYYNTKLFEDTAEILEETDTYVLHGYSVLVDGKQMDAYCCWNRTRWGDWYCPDNVHVEIVCYQQWNFLVPVGYDGSIAGLMDARLDWVDGTYITDYNPADFALFRAY